MKKFYYIFLSFLIISQLTQAAGLDDFIITVQSDNPGASAADQFIIPTTGGGYNYNVDCNDDGTDEFTAQTGDVTCDYGALGGAGTYTIRIEDNTGAGTGFPRIFFDDTGDAEKITGINQWGTGQWTSMKSAFQGCSNLNDTGGAATDTPDLSAVTDMTGMFLNASAFNQDISSWNTAGVMFMRNMFFAANAFNQDISSWNTASVTDMAGMFWNTNAFNQNIGSWNTTSVTDMAAMFRNTNAFNQNIGSWDTAAVTTMRNMFYDANAFNQDISSWDTAGVTDMRAMFFGANDFNQNIGSWDTAAVTDMSIMFLSASTFNQDIGSWDTASVTDMGFMYSGASAFNQNLGAWNVGSLTGAEGMFENTALSTTNYDALLISWDAQFLQSGVIFSGGNSTFCNAAAARTNMINNDGWIITDGGLDCGLIFANGFEDASIASFQASEKQFEYDFSKITEKLNEQPLLIARGLDITGKAAIQFYLRNDLGQLQIRMDDFDSIQNDWIIGQWQSIDNNKITTISW